MIVPDTNVLVYAYNLSAPLHRKARQWWEGCLSHTEPIGMPWIVVLAFTRLMTHPTLNENPMTVSQVRTAIESWLSQECLQLLTPSQRTFAHFIRLLESTGTGGNLTTDAMIAALAIENGGTVHTTDRDFDRFPGVRWENPLGA